MIMYRVESIATDENVSYVPGTVIPFGLPQEAEGFFSDARVAVRLAEEITERARRFDREGEGFNFFGRVVTEYIPVDELAADVAEYGYENVKAAWDQVEGD